MKNIKDSIINLLFNDNPEELKRIIDKPFRINQIIEFIFDKKNFDIKEYSNLPKELRDSLNGRYSVLNITPSAEKISKDQTTKILFQLNDDNYIESVILKDKNNRITFCISTQSGCKMACTICKTGDMGFKRNLDYSEIISQILFLFKKAVGLDNIVFMGMGEPLDNFDNLVKTIKILTNAMNFSISRITVSTCGIIDKIKELLKIFPNLRIAVSLNAVIQEKREKIMPIAKSNKLDDLLKTLNECYLLYKKRISLEYVLMKNFNMFDEDLKGFKKINKNFHINLIPINDNDSNILPDEDEINKFYLNLKKMGFNVTKRMRRGSDINADCGQLYHDFNKKI